MRSALDCDTDVHEALRDRWYRLRHDNPKLRIRDAARLLGVSEMHLVSLGCGESATRLSDHWLAMVAQFADFGDVMALTRNDLAVHELTGHYAAGFGKAGELNELGGSERRLDLEQWAFAFAVCEPTAASNRYSIQFFDHVGDAVHKVYLTDRSDRAEYAAFVSRFRAQDQRPGSEPVALTTAGDLSSGLAAASDGVAGDHQQRSLSTNAVSTLLAIAAERGLDVLVDVANAGALQRYAGRISNTCVTGPWFNVLDKAFSLHLREDGIARVALTASGDDTRAIAVRAYDSRGASICGLSIRTAKDRFSQHALQLALNSLRAPTTDAVADSAEQPA